MNETSKHLTFNANLAHLDPIDPDMMVIKISEVYKARPGLIAVYMQQRIGLVPSTTPAPIATSINIGSPLLATPPASKPTSFVTSGATTSKTREDQPGQQPPATTTASLPGRFSNTFLTCMSHSENHLPSHTHTLPIGRVCCEG
jgi:hypothetical protein